MLIFQTGHSKSVSVLPPDPLFIFCSHLVRTLQYLLESICQPYFIFLRMPMYYPLRRCSPDAQLNLMLLAHPKKIKKGKMVCYVAHLSWSCTHIRVREHQIFSVKWEYTCLVWFCQCGSKKETFASHLDTASFTNLHV